MKNDIKNRTDIELLVNVFYDKIKKDKTLSLFFTDIVPVNWENHLPLMYNFWENILFYTGNYEGNPLNLHKHLSEMKTLTKRHFQHWNLLFINTVDELFEGEKAELIKKRAINISAVIQENLLLKL